MTRDEVLRYLDLPSPSMKEALDLLSRVAPLMTTVYINGPSGSGKEFAARAVHAFSSRADGPFIAVNCGAIPKELLESELFGSEKGAYTGSVRTRAGLLENANGGTLFLDEIGDMPFDMQVKLLRVLEERKFSRVGGEKEIKADVRLVCATHRDLQVLVESGQFREDLFYRINVFPVTLCGLHERREDIPRLVDLILKRFKGQGGLGELPSFSGPALVALQDARWPGNVRQLRNVIERASVLYPGQVVGASEIERMLAPRKPIERVVETQALIESITGMLPLREEAPPLSPVDSSDVYSGPNDLQAFLEANPDFNFRDHITKIEISFIKGALAQTQGSVSAAARLLGLQRTTLIEKMRKYGVMREEV
jgi:sigma-54 specific flagellar transcriptional regulator A